MKMLLFEFSQAQSIKNMLKLYMYANVYIPNNIFFEWKYFVIITKKYMSLKVCNTLFKYNTTDIDALQEKKKKVSIIL